MVQLGAFSKIVRYQHCQTLLTLTCLILPHSLNGKFSLSRPRLVAWSRSCRLDAGCWMLDAGCTIPPSSRVYHNRIRRATIGAAAGLTATLHYPAHTSTFTITIAASLSSSSHRQIIKLDHNTTNLDGDRNI